MDGLRLMKRILKSNFLYLIFATFILLSCKTYNTSILENGDLLFVPSVDSGLSGAINNVTQTEKKTSYDHIGILKKEENHLYVLHASPKGGSQKQKLNHFLKEQTKSGQKIDVYRLKSEYQSIISNSVSKAETLVGKPYNFNYILDENSYYCSDFVERAFRNDKIFELIPMNFKNKETGIIDDFWIDFYKKKGKEVPQDEPGTNPNQLASSDKLTRIGELKL